MLVGIALALGLALPALAAEAGPPFPDPVDGQAVYDTAELFSPEARQQAELIIDAIESQTKAEVVVYTQALGRDDITTDEAEAHARALMDQWGVGRRGVDDGLVILFDLDTTNEHGQVQLFAGPGFSSSYLSDDERQAIYQDVMVPLLADQQFDDALLATLGHVVEATVGGGGGATEPPPTEEKVAPGPPFPDPETDRAVYDYAGILSPAEIVKAESTIDAIEARTGAEVVVYTQPVDYDVERRTRPSPEPARSSTSGASAGRASTTGWSSSSTSTRPASTARSSSTRRQASKPPTSPTRTDRRSSRTTWCRSCARRTSTVRSTSRCSGSTPPPRRRTPLACRSVARSTRRSGWSVRRSCSSGCPAGPSSPGAGTARIPVYLDDPSILMPAPPPDLTAASGAFLMDGHSSRRALTTAMLDLASRGLISFREDKGMLGLSHKVGIETSPQAADAVEEAQRARNARKPIGPAEDYALRKLRVIGGDEQGFIEPDKLPEFGPSVSEFDSKLEDHVVKGGWVVEKPSHVVARWVGKGILAIVAGGAAIFLGVNLPASGLTIIGGAAIAGGIVVCLFARSMPSVTMPGAMVRAMLAAYRRTLEKTMQQARSMQQVVDQAGLTWLETPDQAVVWGTALGLQGSIESVLQRSLEDVQQQPQLASSTYFPVWYRTSDGSSFASGLGVWEWRLDLLVLAGARSRRDDVGVGHDRELALVVRWWRRVRRRRLRRWRRRRRRRVLARGRNKDTQAGHACWTRPHDAPIPTARTSPCTRRGPRWRPAGAAGTATILGRHPELLRLARHALRRQRSDARSRRSRARARPHSMRRCRGMPTDSANSCAQAVEGERQHGRAHLLPEPATLERSPEPGPGVDGAMDREGVTHQALGADRDGRPSRPSGSGATRRPTTPPDIPSGGRGSRGRTQTHRPTSRRRRTASRRVDGCRPWRRRAARRRSSSVGRRRTRCSDRTRSWKSGQIAASGATEGSTAAMGTRRYTPAMGAVETMEEFFEKLNAGDREGAVAMMDEKTEMRVHVGDNVQTLRGVERVGGWFLRSDAGLRMIPGDIRDTGNTYEADLLVVRPGRRPSTSTRRFASRPGGSPPSTSRPGSLAPSWSGARAGRAAAHAGLQRTRVLAGATRGVRAPD